MHGANTHTRKARRGREQPASRPGLSLVEVVVSIAITGGLLASVFGVVGISAQRSLHTAETSRAAWLARDLAAEIATKPCEFNVSGTGSTVVDSVLGLVGVDELLDRILLESEVLELKSHAKGPASGVVLEAEIQEGKGRVAFLLIKDGEVVHTMMGAKPYDAFKSEVVGAL